MRSVAKPKPITTAIGVKGGGDTRIVEVSRNDALALSIAVEANRKLGVTTPEWMRKVADLVKSGYESQPSAAARVTIEEPTPVNLTLGVTVWEQKPPERNPHAVVKLPDGLWMPPASALSEAVDLEDWIREAERQIAGEQEPFRLLLAPVATGLITAGVLAVLARLAGGWAAFVLGVMLVVAEFAGSMMRKNLIRDQGRRVAAYRRRLRDLRIPPKTGASDSDQPNPQPHRATPA